MLWLIILFENNMLCRNCWDTEQLHTQNVWQAQIRFSWGHTALQMQSGIPLQSWISVAFYVQRTLQALRWVSNTAKHFPKKILCSFFSQNMTLFFGLVFGRPAALRCGLAAFAGCPNKGQITESLLFGTIPEFIRTPLLSASRSCTNSANQPAWTCGYLGGVASVQRVFGHEGLQGGEGQVSQVLLVLQRQAQLAQEQPRQEVLPAELPGQVVLGHRGCARTQRGFFFFSPF